VSGSESNQQLMPVERDVECKSYEASTRLCLMVGFETPMRVILHPDDGSATGTTSLVR
jgi:hypothetical protein